MGADQVARPTGTRENEDAFAAHPVTVQDRPPNFRGDDGSLYLIRCFVCAPATGKENWAVNVARGLCTWCGWSEDS